jgi:hypothetical protein
MKNIDVRNDKRLDKESKWNNVSFTPHNVVRKNFTYFKEEITTKTSCFLKEEDVFIFGASPETVSRVCEQECVR